MEINMSKRCWWTFLFIFAYLSILTGRIYGWELLGCYGGVLYMVHFRLSPRLDHTYNQCVWTIDLNDSKGLEEEDAPSLSSSFFFFSLFHFFQLSSFSFFVYIFSARQSYQYFFSFFNQNGLCAWNLWWDFHHPPSHMDFCVKVKCARSRPLFECVHR